MLRSLCTFEVAGQRFALDAARVQEVVRVERITPVPRAPAAVTGLLNLRGLIVLAVDAAARLGLAAPTASSGDVGEARVTTGVGTSAQPLAVVLASPEGAMALLVADVFEIMQTDARRFVPPDVTQEQPAAGLMQGTYRADEHLTMVLDADQVLRSGMRAAAGC